ncbi:MAG: hypothetical protein ACI9U2_004755 [Bradymonadia bacterium]|jgi:hypothetical protein
MHAPKSPFRSLSRFTQSAQDAPIQRRANGHDVARQLHSNPAFKPQMIARQGTPAVQRKEKRGRRLGGAPSFLSPEGLQVHGQVKGMIERIELSGPAMVLAAAILAATSTPEELLATQAAGAASGGGAPLGAEAEAISGLRKIGNGQLNRVIGGHLAMNSDTLSNEERLYWEGVRRAFGL